MSSPVFGVTGWKNSGKTTLATRLITELTGRGLVVSTVKHAHHAFDIDKPGTDSHRHREAGASEVMIVSGHRWALMHELREEDEPPMIQALERISPCDLILVEGYKREKHPKIEARRLASTKSGLLAPDDPTIVAIATDHDTPADGRPLFDLDDVSAIADFIVSHLQLETNDG